MKNKQPKVQPIPKYTILKYKTLPYLSKTKIWYGFLIMIIIATPERFIPTIENPFSFQYTGLPHYITKSSTGSPERINSKEARNVIFKVFEEAGITLQKDYLINTDYSNYRLDGYNPQKKIGFVWLDGTNLAADNFYTLMQRPVFLSTDTEKLSKEVWYFVARHNRKTRHQNNTSDEVKQKFQAYNKQIKKLEKATNYTLQAEQSAAFRFEFITFLIQENKLLKRDADLKKQAKAAFELPTQKQQSLAFEKVVLQYEIACFAEKISFSNEYANYILIQKQNFDMNELRRHHKNLAALHRLSFPETKAIDRAAISQAIIQFDISKDANELEKIIAEQLKIYEQDFSLVELQNLEYLADKDKTFIAPISIFDLRFEYRGYSQNTKTSMLPIDVQNRIKKEAEAINDVKASKKFINEELRKEFEKRKIMIPKMKAVNELKEQVRQYISWAKSQGMN